MIDFIPDITWRVEKRKLSELKEWENNPRILTKDGIKHLTNSVKKFGCCEPLVINTNNMICGGHGRKKVLESLGVQEVDCEIPSRGLTQEEFEELNIRLNKNISGQFDFNMLANNYDIDFLEEVGFNKEIDFGIEIDKPEIVNSENYQQKFTVMVEFENEEQQESLYNQLLSQGYKCKKK